MEVRAVKQQDGIGSGYWELPDSILLFSVRDAFRRPSLQYTDLKTIVVYYGVIAWIQKKYN